MVSEVQTVLGPSNVGELGFTLMHEHVMTSSAGVPVSYPEVADLDDVAETAAIELGALRNEGVSTFVDLTTFDLGRNVLMLQKVAERSGINIIAATGTWLDVPRALAQMGPDVLSALYIRELMKGIDGTDIRAGVIKVANDEGGVSDEGEVVLRAASRAHLKTDVPIFTHTWAPERVGEQQIAIFEEEGVPLNRVCIGHSNDSEDLGYLMGILDKGCWLGLDRYPGTKPGTPDWEQRTVILKHLIDRGYTAKIMLSHDYTSWLGSHPPAVREERKKLNPDGFLFISRRVLPRLRDLGVTDQQIDQIVVGNPQRYFEG